MKIGRNLPCWCGSGKKYKACHMAFDEKIARFQHAGHIVPDRKIIKTEKDIEGIKRSAVINVAVLDEIGEKIKAGMSTQEIDDIVTNTTRKMDSDKAYIKNSENLLKHNSIHGKNGY